MSALGIVIAPNLVSAFDTQHLSHGSRLILLGVLSFGALDTMVVLRIGGRFWKSSFGMQRALLVS